MTSFIEGFHLVMDVVLSGVCAVALFQWRWWAMRAARAEKSAADAWHVSRHFHARLQNGIIPPSQRPTWKGEAS